MTLIIVMTLLLWDKGNSRPLLWGVSYGIWGWGGVVGGLFVCLFAREFGRPSVPSRGPQGSATSPE